MVPRHSIKCSYFKNPPGLRDADDCDCGAITALPKQRILAHGALMATANRAIVHRDAAIKFITRELIANEVGCKDGYPLILQELIAKELTDPKYGWPTVEEALNFLKERFAWTQ